MNKYPTITIRVPQELLDMIDKTADEFEESRSGYIRLAILHHIYRGERYEQ